MVCPLDKAGKDGADGPNRSHRIELFTCFLSKPEAHSQSALSTLDWDGGTQLPGQRLVG